MAFQTCDLRFKICLKCQQVRHVMTLQILIRLTFFFHPIESVQTHDNLTELPSLHIPDHKMAPEMSGGLNLLKKKLHLPTRTQTAGVTVAWWQNPARTLVSAWSGNIPWEVAVNLDRQESGQTHLCTFSLFFTLRSRPCRLQQEH